LRSELRGLLEQIDALVVKLLERGGQKFTIEQFMAP